MTTANQVSWLTALRRYAAFLVLANLAWEFAQLPLYTLWWEGTTAEIVFAAVHCTGGDLLIALIALLGALVLAGRPGWPRERFRAVAAIAVASGLAYTIFSEWLNTEIRGSWAYTEFMPRLPLIGSGIAPLAQWLILPCLGLVWATGRLRGLRRAAPTGASR